MSPASELASHIQSRLNGFQPETAIILGSGLGRLGDEIISPITVPYAEIPGFPLSTVSGHKGCLLAGTLENTKVLCMQGRIHLYEGHTPQSINTVISAFRLLGIKKLIVTNAAGSLTPDMPAGSLMLIKDHINLNLPNPLTGPNDDSIGPRFPDMSNAYDAAERQKIKELASRLNIKLFEGVYIMALGPCFDTAAEVRAFRILGADAVGMSTVPEVICAVHAGIKVIGFSVITNLGTGLKDSPQSHAETLAQADKASASLTRLIKNYLREG